MILVILNMPAFLVVLMKLVADGDGAVYKDASADAAADASADDTACDATVDAPLVRAARINC